MPVTMPDEAPIVAKPVAELVHSPPLAGSVKAVAAPWHMLPGGTDLAAGVVLIVTVCVAKHPVTGNV